MPRRRKRRFRVWKDPSQTVVINDAISPTLQFAAQRYPQATRRAMRHVAFKLQKTLKDELRGSKAGFKNLDPLTDTTKDGGLEHVGRQWKRRRKKTFPGGDRGSSLVQAIGYQTSKNGNQAHVGWLSPSAAKAGERFQKGSRYVVTRKMQKLFFAAQKAKRVKWIPKVGSVIIVPPRNFIDPVHRAYEPRIVSLLEARIIRNLGINEEAAEAVGIL